MTADVRDNGAVITSLPLIRFYVPFDGHNHMHALGSDPQQLAISGLGVEFWALPGHTERRFRVYEIGGFLEETSMLVGTPPTAHGVTWHLYEVPLC